MYYQRNIMGVRFPLICDAQTPIKRSMYLFIFFFFQTKYLKNANEHY